MISSIAGLVMGALIFPAPDGSAWNALPLAGSYLLSFSAAVGVSALLSTVFVALAGKLGRLEDEYDFERLRAGVRLIQG